MYNENMIPSLLDHAQRTENYHATIARRQKNYDEKRQRVRDALKKAHEALERYNERFIYHGSKVKSKNPKVDVIHHYNKAIEMQEKVKSIKARIEQLTEALLYINS